MPYSDEEMRADVADLSRDAEQIVATLFKVGQSADNVTAALLRMERNVVSAIRRVEHTVARDIQERESRRITTRFRVWRVMLGVRVRTWMYGRPASN